LLWWLLLAGQWTHPLLLARLLLQGLLSGRMGSRLLQQLRHRKRRCCQTVNRLLRAWTCLL